MSIDRKALASLLLIILAAGCGDARDAAGGAPGSEPPAVSPIINGELDGRDHPNVGTLVAFFPDGPFPLCSGSLISERAFLTAAHCIFRLAQLGAEPIPGVSFDPVFDPANSKIIRGTPVVHPQYDAELGAYDLAVVELDRPVRHLEPVRVVEEGFLDRLGPRRLERATFVTVGYGTDDIALFWNRGTRRSAEERFVGLIGIDEYGTDQDLWLALGGLYADGYGTPCWGDSGGPHLLGDRVVAVSTFAWCGYDDSETVFLGDAYNEASRLDLPLAHAFLRPYLRRGDHHDRH